MKSSWKKGADLIEDNAEDHLPTEVKATSEPAAITCDPEAMFRALSTVALIQFDLLSIYLYSFKHLHLAKAVSKILRVSVARLPAVLVTE